MASFQKGQSFIESAAEALPRVPTFVVKPQEERCEEKCCPCFWKDDGVPKVPVFSWVFDPKNKYLNDNKYMDWFGGLGLKYCDARRKDFMGVALAVTVVAIVVAVYGSLSLSNNNDTVYYTAWGTAWFKNHTNAAGEDGPHARKIALGLVKFTEFYCPDAYRANSNKWDCKSESATKWEDVDEKVALASGFPWAKVEECKAQAEGNQFGATSTTVTLIFALNGCLARIRRNADTNFQKLLGCLPDTFGCLSLFQALANFYIGCYVGMPRKVNGLKAHYYVGPAYAAYSCVLIAAVLRCLLHWMTPVPGKGVETCCCDFSEFVDEDFEDEDEDESSSHGKHRRGRLTRALSSFMHGGHRHSRGHQITPISEDAPVKSWDTSEVGFADLEKADAIAKAGPEEKRGCGARTTEAATWLTAVSFDEDTVEPT